MMPSLGRASVLPDGLFSSQKSQFEYILEGLTLENVDIFCGHLLHFESIWCIHFSNIFYFNQNVAFQGKWAIFFAENL
jgi:hypothetical protein